MSRITVFASCDSKYFQEYAESFIMSAYSQGYDTHLHLIDPTPEDLFYNEKLCECLNERYSANYNFSTEHKRFRLVKLPKGMEERVYYACNRFLMAPKIITQYKRVFISDIDCVFRKPIFIDNSDIGLFLRTPLPGTVGWENEGTRIAAGLVYGTINSIFFFKKVSFLIRQFLSEGNGWFSDQVALYRAYKEILESNLIIHKFSPEEMDWEFNENSCIWTAKGDRKVNSKYLAEKKKYELLL